MPVATSQRRIDLSSEPEAIDFESGDQAKVDIPAKCPSKTWMHLPVLVSQSLRVASAASIRSRSQPTDLTTVSHGEIVSYSQQLATVRPSGEKRTDATPLLCPLKTNFSAYGAYCIFLGNGTGVVSLGVSGGVSAGVSAGVSPGVAVELRDDLWGDSLPLRSYSSLSSSG